jgi:tetratricopeptide (TPR) repeat protein
MRTAALAAVIGVTSVGTLGALAIWQGPGLLLGAGNGIGRWLENAESGSGVEKALYRLMKLPGGDILYRRSPRETRPELTSLINTDQAGANQSSAPLYSLRAMEDEQALDFDAAERDWKTWAQKANDKPAAELDLADFYERRLRPQEELQALEAVGNSTSIAQERWTATGSQRAWQAWERTLQVVDRFALPRTVAQREYAGWEQRYPQEPAVYERELAFDIAGKDFNATTALIARYRKAFPADKEFPVTAEAQLEAARGSAKDGLAAYDRSFEPLWPASLVKDYCDLLTSGRQTQKASDALRADLAAHPEGGAEPLRDAAKLFYIDQHLGQLEAAKAVLAAYRTRKDARGAEWTTDELYVLGRLLEEVQDFPEAARFYYALAALKKTPDTEEKGLAGLARILLTAPEQPLRLGAGNLALYKNIASMDRGPGYLNGILSLWLNSQGPSDEYATEDQLATPYFHRAKAAELVAEIDKRFPQAAERPELHVQLMNAYAVYSENDAVIREGTGFLAQFPTDSHRVEVALTVADVYSRTNQPEKEFALYKDLLKELAARADGVPLGAPGSEYNKPVAGEPAPTPVVVMNPSQDDDAGDQTVAVTRRPAPPSPAEAPGGTRSSQYAQVLDRYLSRLVSMRRLPDALQVLRGELDRNPQDPGLYERLAEFLDQNRLNAHEEEVYQRAIDRFQDTGAITGWYGKLARFYLRERRTQEYDALSRKVVGIFSGTQLEEYLSEARAPDSQLGMAVELYAHNRFPHDMTFVRDLLRDYRARRQYGEMEKLLWEHWWESPDLRDQLFAELSSSGRLDAQLELLRHDTPEIDKGDWSGLARSNPAAERFWMESCLWQSRFEQGMGAAEALAAEYPANEELGRTASSLDRSLAYFHPEDTDKAVAIEQRLLLSRPGDLDTMARIGDIYADRGRMSEAAPFFARMAEARPGDADGYLQSATVFWDYFDFGSALAQLHKGRERLGQPTLFGYQAGAIEESRGNLASAVKEYVASSLQPPNQPSSDQPSSDQPSTDQPSSEGRDRLLTLARRAPLHDAVEAETGGLLKTPAPTGAAISLRTDVLDAQHRKDDMVRELKQAIAQTESFDTLDALTQAARSHALPEVEEAALRRQIALTADPVHQLELRYQLVTLLEQRSGPAATAEVDAIYREHPKVLGVVRSTVDYDWDHARKPQAVTVLLDSAQIAYPELKQKFQLEGARKLTELGEYPRAKTLLEPLLAQSPLDAAVEEALADNYARSGDQAGLESFYRAELATVKASTLERSEKTMRLAQLRRGMISAAGLLGNWGDAADQYIELINAYPDDAALAQEAALVAGAHGQRDKLFSFYRKTIDASPRDARWSIVLARLEMALEDYPAAIDAFGKAIRIRPEQQDLYQSRADLEERLHKLDDAVADYEKLYALSYRDPQWMVKAAEARARQGRGADAVKALEEAWITGRPASAGNCFQVAERLEQWGLLDEARKYAEQGIDLAGDDLLANPGNHAGAATYARIMARQRQTDAAFTRLALARQQAEKLPMTAIAQQVAQQGFSAVTDAEWRRQRLQIRTEQAQQGFAQALRTMAEVVGEYATPEERSQFAAWLKTKQASAVDGGELRIVYLPAMQAAGLEDMQSDLLWEFAEQSGNPGRGELDAWLQIKRSRVQLEGAGQKIEDLAAATEPKYKPAVWSSAVDVYRTLGDDAGELRVWDKLAASTRLDGESQLRYFKLLLAARPRDMIRKASSDVAAQYLVANGKPEQALAGISLRAETMPPVWKKAYTGLAGLYLREHNPEIRSSFDGALGGDATIGERVQHPADRNQQLAGEAWFYYGSRYGEYLDQDKDPLAEGYLESELEHTPEQSGAYKELADYSAEAGRAESALADYDRSLQLNKDQPAVLDSMAILEFKLGRKPEALASWQQAIKLLAAEMDARRVPETFWGDFTQVLGDAAAHGQYASISADVDAMLRIYIARNGEYQVESLLEAGYHANGDSLDWLLEIVSSAHQPGEVLFTLQQSNWIAKGQHSRLLGRIVELKRRQAEVKPGEVDYDLDRAEFNFVDALLDEKKFAEAAAEFHRIPEDKRNGSNWLGVELRLAEANNQIAQLVAEWKKDPARAPAANELQGEVNSLSEPSKRIVMRFVYERALDSRELTAPNFLGLAAIDLDEKNAAAAVQLLQRLTLVSSDPYTDTDSAASLLERRGQFSQAIQFLQPLAEAFPWEPGYKVRLAVAQLKVDPHAQAALGVLAAVAADQKAKYADRLNAAIALNGHGAGTSLGSGELDLLSHAGCPSADDADKPFFVEARRVAAACATSDKTREELLRAALAEAPQNQQVRVQYLLPAFASGQDARALIAGESILDGILSQESWQSSAITYTNRYTRRLGVPSAPEISPADASKLEWFAIHAWEKRQEPEKALTFITAAKIWERDPAQLHLLEKEGDRLQTDINREQENDARAPKIHNELDQDRVVRPRLLPGMAFVPKRQASLEDAQ